MPQHATFIATPDEFFSKITATQYASSVTGPGRSNMGGVIGADGNDYYVLPCSNAGGSPKTSFTLWNIRTGDFHNYTDDAINTLLGVSTWPQAGIVQPIQGTKYIWLMWSEGTAHATFIWRGRCVSVESVDTLAVATALPSLDDESPSLESFSSSRVQCGFYNGVTGNLRLFLNNIRHGTVSAEHSTCPYVDLAIQPPNNTVGLHNLWSRPIEPSVLDPTFFDIFTNGSVAPILSNGVFTMGVDPVTGVQFMLFYIGLIQWTYIQAHPSDSVAFPFITGVGLYRYDFPTVLTSERPPDAYFPWYLGSGDSITGPIVGPDFSDSNRHLDGTLNVVTSPGDRPADDYTSVNIYSFPDQRIVGMHYMTFGEIGTSDLLDFPSATLTDQNNYIVMARSYTSAADLATANRGTYIRVKIYRYDAQVPLAATLVIDESYPIFDTVLDLGVNPVDKNTVPPQFIQTVQTADRNYFYIFGDPSKLPVGVGIFAGGRAVHTDNISAPIPDAGEASEIDFVSFLDTWWMLSDQAALWAENPWLVTYVDNTDTNPSLLMTPRWEWTESDTNHKSGPQVEVYVARDGTVSDRRNRIRGKGRALQLHFESSSQKPFNLLGWTINLDKNANF